MVEVSVICTAYNHAPYIRSALDGFVSQKTDFEYEVIVHDDASTDETADIIREYEKKYPNIIKPIYQSQNTYSRNINAFDLYIMPMVHGRYIAFCEGDDYWIDENKLQLQYDYMEKHPECSLVTHEALLYDCRKNRQRKYYKFRRNDLVDDNIKTSEVINNLSIFPLASMFFRKNYYEKHDQFLKTVPGFDYVYKTLLATDGTVHPIRRVMSVYRYNTVGSWTSRIGRNKEKSIDHLNDSIKTYEKINSYTNYAFKEDIDKCIMHRRFLILLAQSDYKQAKLPIYREFYRKLNWKSKLMIFISKFRHK